MSLYISDLDLLAFLWTNKSSKTKLQAKVLRSSLVSCPGLRGRVLVLLWWHWKCL